MTIYLLYYDTDGTGAREEWNVFYTPVEAFDSEEKRQARIDFIKSQYPDEGYEFQEVDIEFTEDLHAPL